MSVSQLSNGRLLFMCPGCNCLHGPTVGGDGWEWNQSVESPTLRPSILVKGVENITEAERQAILSGVEVEPRETRCHSYVTDGSIQFLADCTHALAGKTVPIPDMETA